MPDEKDRLFDALREELAGAPAPFQEAVHKWILGLREKLAKLGVPPHDVDEWALKKIRDRVQGAAPGAAAAIPPEDVSRVADYLEKPVAPPEAPEVPGAPELPKGPEPPKPDPEALLKKVEAFRQQLAATAFGGIAALGVTLTPEAQAAMDDLFGEEKPEAEKKPAPEGAPPKPPELPDPEGLMKKVEAHEAALKASMAAMLRSLGIEPKPVLDTVFEGDEDAIKPQIPGAQWQEAQSTADAQKPSPPQERPDPDALLKKVEEFESTLKDRILKAFDQLGIDRAKAGDIFA